MKKIKNLMTLTAGSLFNKTGKVKAKIKDFLADTKGDGGFNVLIVIVIGVIVAGLVIIALKEFFPTLWTGITNKINTTLEI